MSLSDLLARLRGEWIRRKLFVQSLGRVRIGAGFRAYGPLQIIGQGHIHLGRDVTVRTDIFGCRTVSLQTQGSREAVIEVGDEVTLLGTHISSGRRVTIGRRAWIEDARIMDSDFHVTGSGEERQKLSVETSAEVAVGEGARIAGRAMILKGVKVGAGACVRPGSVLLREVAEGATVSGFPARAERPPGAPASSPDLTRASSPDLTKTIQ
jgi:acetyltransferase-like isoleucine patch superfamily enzyme